MQTALLVCETGPKDATMEKTTLDVPADLLASYAAIARQQRRTVRAIMLDALRAYVQGDEPGWAAEPTLPGWVGQLDDTEVTSENVDAWLRSHWAPE
jgi:hypothetical protein